MVLFYAPDITESLVLPEVESGHCVRVLRKQQGDTIDITDGKGYFYKATIEEPHPKHCRVSIVQTIPWTRSWQTSVSIAVAPTKNIDRIEWFAEKATEIGIDRISFLKTRHSERKEIKPERIEKVIIAAMKQSQKAELPRLDDMTDFNSYLKQCQTIEGQKFIAHCYDTDKQPLAQAYRPGEDCLILIGPEGDFSEEEVDLALQHGFQPISLGNSRLRTETAALVACHTIHILNNER